MLHHLSLDDLDRYEAEYAQEIERIQKLINNNVDEFGANYDLRLLSYEGELKKVVAEKQKRIAVEAIRKTECVYVPEPMDDDNLPF